MKDTRPAKLKLIQTLTKSHLDRKKRFDDLDVFYLDDEERKSIQKEIDKLDNGIEQNIVEARCLFTPQFNDFLSSEICLILYVFSSAYSSDIPRRLDSRDFETILRGNPNEIIEINDSLEPNGNLHKHIFTFEKNGGYSIQTRNFVLLNQFLMKDNK